MMLWHIFSYSVVKKQDEIEKMFYLRFPSHVAKTNVDENLGV